MIRAVDEPTAQTYDGAAREWERRRRPEDVAPARRFGTRIRSGGVRVDLGCGPGFHVASLGAPVVALDVARAMLRLTRARAPHAHSVCADLEALPFRRGSLAGAWAEKSYVHVPSQRLPMALAQLHWTLEVGAPIALRVGAGREERRLPGGDFPGRFFAEWESDRLTDVVVGAGFELGAVTNADRWIDVEATRLRSLPDTVGPGLRLLVCGLNPSEYAADVGVGFARPGNRFWPAARAAGLVHVDRDSLAAFADGVGFTDLVKHATPRADALTPEEYAVGLGRVERVVRWLAPAAVCFVGLAGWRSVLGRTAVPGPVKEGFGGRPTYLAPSTSGANASASFDVLVEHLRAAARLAAT